MNQFIKYMITVDKKVNNNLNLKMLEEQSSLGRVITEFMQSAQQSLLHVITSLQSDQLLEQMRNDQNLYNEKMNYINEMIKQHFVPQPINQVLVKELEGLKEVNAELGKRLEESKQEYIAELSNIEVQYNQFLVEKDNQKRVMENALQQKSHQIFILNKDFSIKTKDVQTHSQNLQKQLHINQSALSTTKIDLEESLRQNEQLQKQITALKQLQNQFKQQNTAKTTQLSTKYTEIQQQNSQLHQKINSLEQFIKSMATVEQSYLQTIQRMKEDMFLIKQEWEKRCQQIQRELTEEYRAKLIGQEEGMNEKLKSYMEELKMGKNVIIESSQEILESKRQLMQERFNSEVKRFEQDMAQIEQQLLQEKARAKQLSAQLKALHEKLSVRQSQLQENKQRFQTELKSHESSSKSKQEQFQHRLSHQKLQTDKEIDRLRKTQNMLLKDLKASKLQKQQILRQVHSLKEQFNNYKQKQLKQAKRLKELEHTNESSNMKIMELKKDLAIMGEKSSMDEKTIKDKNNEIHRHQHNSTQLKHDYKELDTAARRLELKISELNLKVKEQERVRAQLTHKQQKLYLLVRKLSKQLPLLKQDIAFHINVHKANLQSLLLSVSDHITTHSQSLKSSHKHKINSLLDQVQEQRIKQTLEQESLIRQNQNMKKQIKLLEQVMREKEDDYVYERERVVSVEVEKCRVVMQEDVAREREEKRRVEEKMYQQDKRHDYLLAKSEKEVAKHISSFMAKWEHKIYQSQQLLAFKQTTLRDATTQIQKLASQLQSTQHQLHSSQERLAKHQRKYDSLKQQRDKTIDQMMKRLEKQTKHKLALERQLKDIRGEIIKTQANTNSSSPFNNYSFTDRENTNVYTNAFQTATQDKVKTHAKHTNREKELSEIRQMIAKTYKVVENGPDKDSPIHKGKLF